MRIVKGNGQFIVNGKDVPWSCLVPTVVDQVKNGMNNSRCEFFFLTYPTTVAEAIQYFNNFPIWWLKADEKLVMLIAEFV